ncbi:MAG: hypothetical protein ACOCM8_00685 [Acetivibrio ethanolgignens]
MKEQLITVAAILGAGCFVMIVHELIKSLVFVIRSRGQSSEKHKIFHIYQYIDPILFGFSGFSKPYMYRMRDRKTNLYVGIAGFITLLVVAVAGLLVCRTTQTVAVFVIAQYMSVLSIGMFFVNLFPVSDFDVGLIVSGVEPEKYFSIIKNDYTIKMILILTIILGIIRSFSANIFLFLLER